jgi:hypothetical protein
MAASVAKAHAVSSGHSAGMSLASAKSSAFSAGLAG